MTAFPLPHHDAQPAAIRAQATAAKTNGDAYLTLSGQLSGRANQAASLTDGYIEAPTGAVTANPQASAGQLQRAALLATGSLNRYADAVDTYNVGIDDLNKRYADAKANNFGLPATATPAEVQAADQALQNQLLGERDTLLTDLDAEATAISGTLQGGPTDQTMMLLIAAGYLPMETLEDFPSINVHALNTLRSYINEGRKFLKAPGKFMKLYAMLEASKDLNKVAAQLQGQEKAWGAILRGMANTFGEQDLRTVQAFARSPMASQDMATVMAHLGQVAKAGANAEGALTSWINAAKVTGKLGTTLGWGSIAANSFDLGQLIGETINDPQGAMTWDNGLRAVGDVTGLVSTGGGMLAAAGMLTLGPVGAGILIGAGLISGGIMVYRNWDDIVANGAAAVDWTKERAGEFENFMDRKTAELGTAVKDGMNDFMSYLDPRNRQFPDALEYVNDIGDSLSDAWHAATPW